jgi:serine/threonine-protein kinase
VALLGLLLVLVVATIASLGDRDGGDADAAPATVVETVSDAAPPGTPPPSGRVTS